MSNEIAAEKLQNPNADYLQELYKDKKTIQLSGINFKHVNNLLDKEIACVKQHLFKFKDTTANDTSSVKEGRIVSKQEKIFLPVKENPNYNFVGRILGPRGYTAKQLEQKLDCKIMIRGRGSMRDQNKEEQNRNKPNWEHLMEDLHVLISISDYETHIDQKMATIKDSVNTFIQEGLNTMVRIHSGINNSIVLPTKRLPKFFSGEIERIMQDFKSPTHELVFDNPVKIPNALKTNDLNRRMLLLKFTHSSYVLMSNYCTLQEGEMVTLHLVSGYLVLKCILENSHYQWQLNKDYSYSLLSDSENIEWKSLQNESKSTILVLEIFQTKETNWEKILSSPTELMSKTDYELIMSDIKRRISFTKKALSKEEEDDSIVFLDAEFAFNKSGRCLPVQVTLINIQGEILLNTIVTPRSYIYDYGTRFHGLGETDIHGQMDEIECLARVRQLVKGKILVGCDLHNDISVLKIKLEEITGVIDLSTISYPQYHHSVSTDIHWIRSLKELSNSILGKEIQTGYHSSLEDTETIREIYIALKSKSDKSFENLVTVPDLWDESDIESVEFISPEVSKIEAVSSTNRVMKCDASLQVPEIEMQWLNTEIQTNMVQHLDQCTLTDLEDVIDMSLMIKGKEHLISQVVYASKDGDTYCNKL